MRIWSEDHMGFVEISRTERYFTEEELAEFVVSVQTQGYSGYTFVWFQKTQLDQFRAELQDLDEIRKGKSSLTGHDPSGQEVCTLTIGAVNRCGHLRVSVDFTHRERDSNGDEAFDHHVRTGFALDPSCLPDVVAELGKLMDGVVPKPSDYDQEPQPLDPTWPGLSWRFLARDWRRPMRQVLHLTGDGLTWFDELVVGDWFHIEHMDGRHWMRVGDACINVTIPK